MLTGFFFAIVYTLIGVPIARIADATSRKGTMTVSLVIWSGFTALSGLAWSKTAMIAARMGVGIGEAGGSPPAHAIVSDLYEPDKRARALAVYSSGLYIGTLLANVGGGWISDNFDWQTAFFAVGMPGVILALIIQFTLREPMKGLSGVKQTTQTYTFWQSFKHLWSLKSFRYFSLATGAGTFVTYGLNDWMVPFMERTHHLSRTEIGVTFGIVAGIFGAIGTIGGGMLADKLGKKDRRWFLWVPMWGKFLGAPIFLAGLFMPSPYLSLACYGAGLVLAAAYLGPSLAVTHSLVPPGMRAMSSAVLFVFLNILGIGLGPMFVGMWSDMINDASSCVLVDQAVQMAHACPKAEDVFAAIRKAPEMMTVMQDAGLTKVVKGAVTLPAPLTQNILDTAVSHGFQMGDLPQKAGWGGNVTYWLRTTFPAVTAAGVTQESLRWAMIICIIITYPLAFLWHAGAMALPKGELDSNGNAVTEAATMGDANAQKT
jgi:predicted MFS family arabinose efflux permease